MKQSILVLLVLLGGISWLFFRSKLAAFTSRLGLALRIAAVVYVALLAYRLITAPVDQEELTVAGLSLLFFAGLWGVAWLVTRSMARTR